LLACAVLLLALGNEAATDDVVTLANGDRISGKIVSKGRRTLRLKTPYGTLLIGLDKVERLRRADGTEEVLKAPPPAPALPKPVEPLKLALTITGKTFWQAWDAAAAPDDPTLRLELRLDNDAAATWIDDHVDEGEIPKAVVNSFSFTPDSLKVVAGREAKALPPDVRPGRIQLALELPPERAGSRTLRLAYQANAGAAGAPEWRDLASVEVALTLTLGAPNVFRIEQDRGRMEYSKRRMRNVETFQLALKLDTPGPEP
jgi:hypothetical protein